MKLGVRELLEDDVGLGAKKGDIILANVDWAWDSEKVEVLAVIKRGSDPCRSAYKESLRKPTPDEFRAYLDPGVTAGGELIDDEEDLTTNDAESAEGDADEGA